MCVALAILVLVPVSLASIGVEAVLKVVGGLGTPLAARDLGQVRRGGTLSTGSVPPLALGVAPTQSVIGAPRGLIAGWADRGPFNQYARANYRSDQSWMAWRNADCSVAALDWLLGAYGQYLSSLDEAIALVGPGTGLSASLGLLDARGTALAQALAARGLQPRTPGRRLLSSVAELEA